MAEVREIRLRNGGLLKYRLPNCIEQLDFYSKSGWYKLDEDKTLPSIYERTGRAIPAGRPFVLEITGPQSTLDELIADRENTDALTQFAWDLTNTKVSEEKKSSAENGSDEHSSETATLQ